MRLPSLDTTISPLTGYTRAHWETVADGWLTQALRHASPRHALFRIPGRHASSGPESDALEGYARSFLIAAPRIAGGGDALNLAERYAQGLIAGTEPGGDENWLRGVDCVPPLTGKTQPIVEAANIALGLHLCREQVWDRLDDRQREPIVDWLAHHASRKAWPNNWVLFTAIVEAFLSSVGVDTSAYRSDADVRWVESWHLGDGWYTDGQRRNIDYYNAWVIHPFLWAWYDMVGDRDPDGAWRWRQRLAAFLRSYGLMFGSNGSPVQQGRSLTYRTATLAPLWLGQFTGAATEDPGAVRRIASGTLKYFVDAGVGADGPPSLGWRGGEYLPLTQYYSGPGSPLFAGMGFLGLALPTDHAVWAAPETPQPVERGDAVVALPGAGWLLQSTAADGIVRLLNHGSDKITAGTPDPDPVYIKYGYSTHTAAGHGAAFEQGADGEFVVIDAQGRESRRRGIDHHHVGDTSALSRNRFDTGTVTSASVVSGRFEVRIHRVDAGTAVRVREAGQLIADDRPLASDAGDGWAWVSDADGLTSAVIGLLGYDQGAISDTFTAVNALGDNASAPQLVGGEGRIFAALHVLAHTQDAEAAVAEWLDAARVSVSGGLVTVRWQEDSQVSVDFDALPGVP
ncbi:DUF2264 domain-containing protein [Stackebrandtia nassauensis]|uniref:DUF2264 domain-containing protein n=1 Tax=Stackebrandtia nassauensis (strain DSM 44728 / CIP 108903 / NRRL B-16338 / NBRC 102104 / LLR-40K-21) TaxID=446470 RepID=D3Q4A9_STANL|nr:DUF2264 domain-containing protein [Stackebrandtia nassauensis]ADD45994.1 conserved hypothetical protein [Stackebrandtia nassauensis DSM 44728]